MIDPGEGYRLLTAGEVKEFGDQYFRQRDQSWQDVDYFGYRFDPNRDSAVRRQRTPVDDSIDRLRTAMNQGPYWAAVLLQDLPQQLRNDIAMVLTHFIGGKQ